MTEIKVKREPSEPPASSRRPEAAAAEEFRLFGSVQSLIPCKKVGDPESDHNCWDRPEDMSKKRPLTKVTTSKPGSDVVAETAAAMASVSLVFKYSNSEYSRLLSQACGGVV